MANFEMPVSGWIDFLNELTKIGIIAASAAVALVALNVEIGREI